jgi:spermidine synthase
MIPWTHLGTAAIPGASGELRLMRRGDEFSIRLGQNELMNTRLSGSEEALATLACERLGERPKPRLLIGGLGMGFTLRAALAVLGEGAEIIVAELVPAVIAWARVEMAEVFGTCLTDPRVTIQQVDVGRLIRSERGAYDAILLDVDNGPEALTHLSNDSLYTNEGLRAARAALRPGGILAVWSQGPDASFAKRFAKAGFTVEEIMVRASRAKRGARHIIWLGKTPG